VRDVVLGNHQQAGRILVEAMNDPRSDTTGRAGQQIEMIDQSVCECSGVNSSAWMNNHSGGFVHHDQILIFMDYVQGNCFGNQFDERRLRQINLDLITIA
jgi:hypothetical protein